MERNWRLDAECRTAAPEFDEDIAGEDAYTRAKRYVRAARICRTCRVVAECEAYASTTTGARGVYAGLVHGFRGTHRPADIFRREHRTRNHAPRKRKAM